MVNLTERTGYYLCNSPVDLRKGREGLADIVRASSSYDPTSYDKAFIFYNKKYDTVKYQRNLKIALLVHSLIKLVRILSTSWRCSLSDLNVALYF